MEKLFEHRKEQYDHAVISLAMNQTDQKPMLLRGTVRFERDLTSSEEVLEYESLVLSRRCVSPDEGFAFVRRLYLEGASNEDEFRMPEKFAEIFQYDEGHGLPLPSDASIINVDWPARLFFIKYHKQMVNDPRGPLLNANLPVHTSPKWAIAKWIGVGAEGVDFNNGIAVLLPDYRARIGRIGVGDKNVEVEIEKSSSFCGNLVAKIEAGWEKESHEITAKETDKGFVFSFEKTDSLFHIFIIDATGNEVIDSARVNTNWVEPTGKEVFVTPARKIEQMIEDGENQQVEFKSSVGSGDEMVESILAFANTNDGVILIGVDDNGKLVGIDNPEKEKDRILNFVDLKCEPYVPNLSFDRQTMGGRDILIVHVPKGDNLPYMNRETGVTYMRRNSTDRRTRRPELDRLFSESSSAYRPGVR